MFSYDFLILGPYADPCVHVGAFPSANPLSGWVTSNVPSIPTMFLAVAMNNSCAGVGSLISQWIWLPSEEYTGYTTGNAVCAACSFGTMATAIGLRLYYGRLNKKNVKDARGNQRVWLL